MLIYKHFRQVGKAEKLLHGWLGPYEVIRKTTDLNYEVGLKGRKDKSDIVHVVAMKLFHPPEGKTNETNNNRRRVMTTSENPAQDGQALTILSRTKKRRPGRPRKIIPDVDQAIAKMPMTPKLNLTLVILWLLYRVVKVVHH